MRTFHIGGVAKGNTADSDRKTRKGGIVALERITPVVHEQTDAAGHKTRRTLALTRTGEILIYKDRHQPPIERFSVPNGAEMFVKDGQEVKPGERLCQWDPHMTPIIAEEGGKVRFEDLKENETYRKEKDAGGAERYIIMEHKGDLHPSIVLEDARGNILKAYFIPERAYLEVRNGEEVSAGHILAKTPKEASGNQDIVGGLPRVTEIFEARTPRDAAVMAKVSGKIRVGERKRGKRQIFIQPEDDKGRSIGDEVLHEVPHGKQLRVSAGDYIKAGDALIVGPLKPHDILDITGAESLQEYLVREVQSVYRSQRVEIDDKHIEIIVSQMLRKVKIKEMGDTNLLPGSVMDKFAFMAVNDRLMNECVKIKGKGDSSFEVGKIVIRDAYDEECARIEVEGGKKPTWEAPTPATSEVVLLGITKAAVQSESFISAASFQETTKVLTEAALAGKADYLVGLKENVILGHLVPAGTGFNIHQNAEVRINAPEGNGEAAEVESGELVATPA